MDNSYWKSRSEAFEARYKCLWDGMNALRHFGDKEVAELAIERMAASVEIELPPSPEKPEENPRLCGHTKCKRCDMCDSDIGHLICDGKAR